MILSSTEILPCASNMLPKVNLQSLVGFRGEKVLHLDRKDLILQHPFGQDSALYCRETISWWN